MTDPLSGVAAALDRAAELWCSAAGPEGSLDGMPAGGLIAINDALGAVRRHLDAAHARVAAEIARQSRPDLGSEGLARMQGYRTPATLLAATIGTSTGDAIRLVAVGDATAPRQTLSGERAPARHPHVATALASGTIGVPAASAIITLLDRIALRADRATIDEAERTLTAQAAGLTLDQLAAVIRRAEAHLDPDGVLPREDELRGERALHIREERSGMLLFTARLDPENAAPVKAAIESLVTGELRRRANGGAHDRAVDRIGSEHGDLDRRTVPQLQADALADICRHILGCSASALPLATTTVVVRIGLDQLEAGTRFGTIDGIAQPISAGAVRRMAAAGQIIPCVLGGESEILDWGRAKRLFTSAQRLALVERDGGCAFCGLPPGFTEAHHLRWWERDAGPTDLSNGILLCTRCHHRVHDDGWQIRIDGPGTHAKVWFIPPAHIDIARTPRLGGRARYDFAA